MTARPGPPWRSRVWPLTVAFVAVTSLLVTGWAAFTAWPAILHGHPAYTVLLAASPLACGMWVATARRPRPPRVSWWRRLRRGAVLLVVYACVAATAYLRPFPAKSPALTAMASDAHVTVREATTEITLHPGSPRRTGLFFQPGARVDPRAYAAVLRPLAEAGYPVVIAKQPLGVALLAGGAFDSARTQQPDVTGWVLAGHSLGGVQAATDAATFDTADRGRAVGLLLYASYPATDLSGDLTCPVLSVTASADGLATPATIARTMSRLPPRTTYISIDGSVHAYFGDYGTQPGDGTPSITHDQARRQIVDATLAFVAAVDAAAPTSP